MRKNMSKTTGFFLRLKEKEKQYLYTAAKENGLSLSEYIRIRILNNDQNKDRKLQLQKDSAYLQLRTWYLLGKLAKQNLSDAEIKETHDRAQTKLEKYDF